ncbi:MAG: NADH-quinone oxidoreductase subunit H, partial [Actinomycetota bacterium]|nr:NADH-quinone oxidoreductase subunit H [Actinomycetota bacterium]
MSGWAVLLEAAIKVFAVFSLLLTVTLLVVWFERKVVADMQNRLGPMRAGPYGVLQTVADGLKLLFKENIMPRKAETLLYLAAPVAAVIPALLIFLVIPIGRPFTLGDRPIELVGTDLNIGLLYVLALSSMAVYAVVLAGWSSGSKYPLLGGVRASAQMISYEAAMGMALVPVILFTNTTSVTGIVDAQAGDILGFLGVWNVVLIPSFLIFFISGVAETNRAPFDLVEAESEIIGFHTEYSGFRFALFFLAEYINMFNMSALTVAVFFGGWHG